MPKDWLSVAIGGDVAIVGAIGEDSGGNLAGAAYIFQLESGEWVEKKKLTASDAWTNDRFGASVSISGNVAFVGTLYEGGSSGAVYIY